MASIRGEVVGGTTAALLGIPTSIGYGVLALHALGDQYVSHAILAGLYAGLYGLLQLEDVALLTGSVLLFAVLSVAMWLTRNIHRPQPA